MITGKVLFIGYSQEVADLCGDFPVSAICLDTRLPVDAIDLPNLILLQGPANFIPHNRIMHKFDFLVVATPDEEEARFALSLWQENAKHIVLHKERQAITESLPFSFEEAGDYIIGKRNLL